MRIVVTGAGGFVGHALLRQLRGHDVVGLDRELHGMPGVEGDLRDRTVLQRAFAGGCDAVVHLATIPGGAAETDPRLAREVNVDATMELIDVAANAGQRPRFVFASSIAVFGDRLPLAVDDATPIASTMIYGAHKAMMEQWIAAQSRRGAISGLSLRLPGIVARPLAPSGMKSAFMSDLFHALRAGEPIVLPVSPAATMWLMSVERVARNLAHALDDRTEGVLTLPATRVTMADLTGAVAAAAGVSPNLASHSPDPAIEAGFGRQPPLSTPAAQAAGFTADPDISALVAAAFGALT